MTDGSQPKDPNHEFLEADTPREESLSITPRLFILSGIGLVVAIILIHLFAAGIMGIVGLMPAPGAELTSPLGQPTQEPPLPRLQDHPDNDMNALRATQEALLNSYGYLDRQAGTIHIPIERAMELIAAGSGAPGGQPGGQPAGSPEEAGAQLFQTLGCNACHTEPATAAAPSLHGVAGSTVTLDDGSTVTADEAYLRESILNPQAKIVQGYQPIMPSYEGRVSEEQLAALVAYIQSLGSP